MKRYQIIVQHEVIIYAENEKAAQCSLSRNVFLKDRTNVQCITITEIPLIDESNEFIDIRKVPGA